MCLKFLAFVIKAYFPPLIICRFGSHCIKPTLLLLLNLKFSLCKLQFLCQVINFMYSIHLVGYSDNAAFNLFSMSLQDSDNLWWDTFTTEFFEDDAQLTLTFCLEDGPKRYSEYLYLV